MPSRPVDRLPPCILVLWDVDHTLIETRGVGFIIYQRAFKAATGQDLYHLSEVSGRTELDIIAETLRINGLEPSGEAIAGLVNALIAGYEAATSELATTGRVLSGAKETLALLTEDPTIYQTVLTGNLKNVARIKLETFDLAQYLDLEAGAYGEDDHDRTELVYLAQCRTRTITGMTLANRQTVIIGDAPNDVHAAKTAGVHIIAVASGKSDTDKLKQSGAEKVLVDLRDAKRVRYLINSRIRIISSRVADSKSA
ncbi:MAG TPA: HAD hydrolase-like protein [Pseudonocardiaceae bacterium]|nr:HAD hydrolase-like protein [Pseudonocardiaceae bacterium]